MNTELRRSIWERSASTWLDYAAVSRPSLSRVAEEVATCRTVDQIIKTEQRLLNTVLSVGNLPLRKKFWSFLSLLAHSAIPKDIKDSLGVDSFEEYIPVYEAKREVNE